MWQVTWGAGIPDAGGIPVWRSSGRDYALADQERHLGHVIEVDRWQAFDATKMNDAQNGFRYLGGFDSVAEAQEAVERSVRKTASSVYPGAAIDLEPSRRRSRELT